MATTFRTPNPDLDDTGGQVVVDKIGSAGGEAIFLHQDVTLEELCPQLR